MYRTKLGPPDCDSPKIGLIPNEVHKMPLTSSILHHGAHLFFNKPCGCGTQVDREFRIPIFYMLVRLSGDFEYLTEASSPICAIK